MTYPFSEIEGKWQRRWEEAKIFATETNTQKPKYYCLSMFPYPSGFGLHVGHVMSYTPTDVMARFKRAQGFNVLHPMGYDAFGLPAEQHAIQTGIPPEKTTKKAIQNFERQLKTLGLSYDWAREVATCDPAYYKWTQYIFTILYKKGLAYQKEMPVNWCPALRTVLANEEVVDGKSERGGHPVEQRLMKQWMLKITAYAEKLLEGLDKIDWVERTKEGQRNWIGRSEGLQGFFDIEGAHEKLEIFTTRPDTIFGVTFMVLAPEHPFVDKISTSTQKNKVTDYQKQSARKTALDRQTSTEKTGVFTGAFAINPVNKEKIPVWISDYVLMDYGTGAIMAVPGHDERDFEFAKKFDLKIIKVLEGGDLPYAEGGPCVNSDFLNGLEKTTAITKAIRFFENKKRGTKKIQYKLRDWLFSRQRYWGEPFPIVHYKDRTEALPIEALPVTLPPIKDYEPSETGASPISKAPKEWLNYKNPQTGEMGRRETDTMPGSAGSSWYFLRYTDPHNNEEAFSFAAQKYFMPIDLYIGGPEHTVGHLLYARFWQKVLYDEGLVSHEEPFKKLVHQGIILGEDGERMSKSRGNVVNPDELIENYGSDALRLYVLFMGPLEKDRPWKHTGLVGVFKFLNKFWNAIHDEKGQVKIDDAKPSEKLLRLTHQTIKKVTHDLEALAFNTAISQLMIFVNALVQEPNRPRQIIKPFVQCLAPFAPHFAEEIWEQMGEMDFIAVAPWPKFDEKLAQAEQITIAVQINGKTKNKIECNPDAEQTLVETEARALPAISQLLTDGAQIRKVIFVKNRIINFIIH